MLDPAIRRWVEGIGLGRVVDLEIAGRQTGRRRRLMVTLLTVGADWYVGHPNGRAQWVRNLETAGRATVVVRGKRVEVRAVRLPLGDERDEAIRATWTQQPFGADTIYWLARRHVARHGVYFRLERGATAATGLSDGGGGAP